MERTEDLLRYNNEGGLQLIAADTGGFLITGTNDIGTAFRRIDEDMRFHYLLTYAPVNDVMDGKFRTISVKVRRPDVTVFSRRGYRAVRAQGNAPVMAYEAPALALLDASPLPNAFASQANAFAFPEADRPGPDAGRRARHDRQPAVRRRREEVHLQRAGRRGGAGS